MNKIKIIRGQSVSTGLDKIFSAVSTVSTFFLPVFPQVYAP